MGHQSIVRKLLEIEKKMIESRSLSLLGAEPLKPEGVPIDRDHPSLCEDDHAVNSELAANPASHACVRR